MSDEYDGYGRGDYENDDYKRMVAGGEPTGRVRGQGYQGDLQSTKGKVAVAQSGDAGPTSANTPVTDSSLKELDAYGKHRPLGTVFDHGYRGAKGPVGV